MGKNARNKSMEQFSDHVREWFSAALGVPTKIQEKAWKSISQGNDTLVIAPTGSGKTFAAFLYAIDSLMEGKLECAERGIRWQKGVRVLYVSPLKALGADVERNLSVPLAQIMGTAATDLSNAGRSSASRVPKELFIHTGMRTGDTTSSERGKLIRNPPDILITTPESLYLMLTSKAAETLSTVDTVIVDEVHAIAGTKRGAHLSLSLERLDKLLVRSAQRIGLSATVRPRDEVARFLGGVHPVRIESVDDPPAIDVKVSVPVDDMTSVPTFGMNVGYGGMSAGTAVGIPEGESHSKPGKASSGALDIHAHGRSDAWKTDRSLKAAMDANSRAALAMTASAPDTRKGAVSIWPYIESSILDQVLSHRSTIVFVNSRGLCERLTSRLNEMYASRMGFAFFDGMAAEATASVRAAPSAIRSSIGSTTELVLPSNPDISDTVIAKAHHGSVSKDRRLEIERELKSGGLRCVVATSSLELGIDMGEVDLVMQVAPPMSVSSGLQRIGRANHQVGGRSVGIIFPRVRTELVDAVAITEGMIEGRIEPIGIIENALDVLAQQTAAEVAMHADGLSADTWFSTVRRSACYGNLSRTAFDSVIQMLAGRYASGDVADFAPRILIDEEQGLLKPLPRTQRLAVMSAGTIPDRGMYPVMLNAPSGKHGRKRVGELDEEMVHESRVGDVIILGTSTWRISEISNDRVIVEPAVGRSARLPFWHGEGAGRDIESGRYKGELLADLAHALADAAGNDDKAGGGIESELSDGHRAFSDFEKPSFTKEMEERLERDGLDARARRNLSALMMRQREATKGIPDSTHLVVEFTPDDAGGMYMVLHSPYGRRVHEPWALAVSERVRASWGFDAQAAAADDGIILHIPMTDNDPPDATVFLFDPDDAEDLVKGSVSSTSLFAARFRECAARALLMTPVAPGKRAPLWQQRMRGGQLLEAARNSGDFPMLAEAARECLNDVYDLAGFVDIMDRLKKGSIRIRSVRTDAPSPFVAPLLFGYVADNLYAGDLPHAEQAGAALSVDPMLLGELLGTEDVLSLLDEDVVAKVEAELQHTDPDRRVHGAEGVAELLRQLGPLSAAQVAARLDAVPSGDADLSDREDADVDAQAGSQDAACGRPADEAGALKLLHELLVQRRAFEFDLGGKTVWAQAVDAMRLHDVLGIPVPKWAHIREVKAAGVGSNVAELSGAPDGHEAISSAGRSLLDGLVLRYARTHALFCAESIAQNFGLGTSLVEESLLKLSREGVVKKLTAKGAASGCVDGATVGSDDAVGDVWVAVDILKRLRLRSLDKARAAVEPVDTSVYMRYLFELQGVAGGEDRNGMDALADVISMFEGVYLPANLWESAVFPARVSDYSPAMLDELIVAGEVIWDGSTDASSGAHTVAFYPTDSPAAPIAADLDVMSFENSCEPASASLSDTPFVSPQDPSDAAVDLQRLIVSVLAQEGPITFVRMLDLVKMQSASSIEDFDPRPSECADVLLGLLWEGRVSLDSFSVVRCDIDISKLDRSSLIPDGAVSAVQDRRVSSRRGYSRQRSAASAARRSAREQVISRANAFEALEGNWSLVLPAEESDTVRAIDDAESLLFRYGVVTHDIAVAGGLRSGMRSLFTVLRGMEDAGDVLRGRFVDGLEMSQYAARSTIEDLRDGRFTGSDSGGEAVVLDATDPAMLYGSVFPWPDAVQDAVGSKLLRREGCKVVFVGGAPVVYASLRLKDIVAFTDDVALLEQAMVSLRNSVSKGRGSALALSASRQRVVVETLNGESVLGTPFAELLKGIGFVLDTKGMRLL